jgi:homoserine O-acetyltransferase/O-succinyltransferase
MTILWMAILRVGTAMATALISVAVMAADYPAPKEDTWVARDFRFHTGEVIPELRLHYRTIGNPSGEAVLILHGTAGSGANQLTPAFAGELFGPGQPLDAEKYFIILPDSIGAGKSSKPSDGLRTKFPRYNYEDMVAAQYLLVTEGLGIRHLRMVLGNSMGGMQAWIWGVQYPTAMDILVPMASQPSEMSSRNWMMRRLIIDTIRNDPEWKNGDYTSQPRGLKAANVYFGIATNGGTLAYQKLAPTREAADKLLNARLAAPFAADANDFFISGSRRATTIPRPGWIVLKRLCSQLIRPTTNEILPKPASWRTR